MMAYFDNGNKLFDDAIKFCLVNNLQEVLTPTARQVHDVIRHHRCFRQCSIQIVNGDILFLKPHDQKL